jgi:drug/metabolite transporter (DMT)-like permease
MPRARLFAVLAVLNLLWAPTNGILKSLQAAFGAAGLERGFASPSALVLMRWSLFAAFLWAALLFPPTRKVLRPRFPQGADLVKAILIGLFCVSLCYLLYCYALTKTSSIETVLLCTNYPVVMGVLAFLFLREHVSGRRWTSIAIGVVGTYAVGIGFRLPSLDSSHTVGNLIVTVALLLECASLTMATKLVLRSSGLGVLAFEATGSALGCVLYPLLFPKALPLYAFAFSPAAMAGMAYLALVAGVFAFGVWYVLVENAPVSLLMVSTLIQPPAAAVFGVFFLHESVPTNVYYGSALVAAALIVAGTERPARAPGTA